MPLSGADVKAKAAELYKKARVEWMRLNKFVRYARGRQKRPWLPDGTEGEYLDIANKSASNWLDLVIRAITQGLIVDGYGDDSNRPVAWEKAWQANGMDARQHSLHRAAGVLGYSYLIVLPGKDGTAWMRPEAATRLYAEYADPADEWPTFALREVVKDKRYELYDATARYTILGKPGAKAEVQELAHPLEVTPVAQMRWALDLLGTPMGEVEPVIPIQDRIVDATFTLQMVAKYGAFPQRWIAGMSAQPLMGDDGNPVLDADGNPIYPTIKAYIDHILMADDVDTKFGQFAAADLRQYVEALEAHIRHLAAITQTPPHYLLGAIVNISAEALAAAESGLQRKIREKREVLGEGYEQALRLAALAIGDEEAARDTSSQVHWQDVESRSLAQTADALLKLSQLGVPPQLLIEMIPGWTKTDVDKALKILEDGGPIDQLMKDLAAAAQSPALPTG